VNFKELVLHVDDLPLPTDETAAAASAVAERCVFRVSIVCVMRRRIHVCHMRRRINVCHMRRRINVCHMRRRINVCHMRRRINVCHMRRRINVCLSCIYHVWICG
jgi:hypothetical protein